MTISNESKASARVFAQKHKLGEDVEQDLSILLEETWQDGN